MDQIEAEQQCLYYGHQWEYGRWHSVMPKLKISAWVDRPPEHQEALVTQRNKKCDRCGLIETETM